MVKRKVELTPVQSIHRFCVKCQGSQKGPRLCTDTGCWLHPYRLGTNPNRSHVRPAWARKPGTKTFRQVKPKK